MIAYSLLLAHLQNAPPVTIDLPRATAITYSKNTAEFLVSQDNQYPEKNRLFSISDDGILKNKPLISDPRFAVYGFGPSGKAAVTGYNLTLGLEEESRYEEFAGPNITLGLVVRGNWMAFPSSNKLLIWNFTSSWEFSHIVKGVGYSDKYGIDPATGRAVILDRVKGGCQIVVQDPNEDAPATITVPVVEGFYLVHPEKSVEFLDADTFVFAGGQPRAGEPTKNNRYLYVASISKKVIKPVAVIDARGAHNHPGWRNTIAIGKKHIAICVQSGVTLIPTSSAWQALEKG